MFAESGVAAFANIIFRPVSSYSDALDRLMFTDLFHEFIACFIWEAYVAYQHVKGFSGYKFQRGGSIPGGLNGVAEAGEKQEKHPGRVKMVFHDEQSNLTWLQRRNRNGFRRRSHMGRRIAGSTTVNMLPWIIPRILGNDCSAKSKNETPTYQF